MNTLKWIRVIPIFDTDQSMNCDELIRNMNFNDGKGKFFTNTNKRFLTYVQHISDLKRFDISFFKRFGY